jgi:nicotinate dehydrogenase subunit B
VTGVGLTVLFPLSGSGLAQETQEAGNAEVRGGPVVAPDLAGSLARYPSLDAWIRIDADGHVTIFTGKAELGQGVKTALQQLASDELDVPPEVVSVLTVDTELSPNEGYTAGSHSISDSGIAIANAAANVRYLLRLEAATLWSTSLETVSTRAGTVIARDGRTVPYAILAGRMNLSVRARADVSRRPAQERRTIGHSSPRTDLPDKLAGRPAFIHDMRLPGMLHARVIRGPSDGTRLLEPDINALARVPGIVKVVRKNRYAAVLAEKQWPLVQAMRVVSQWQWVADGSVGPVGHIYEELPRMAGETEVILDRQGAPADTMRTLKARYTRPYLMHGSIGPSCAVALLENGRLTIWTHSQGVGFLREAIAELVEIDRKNVRCIHVPGSGCYGHNGADDVAADAALAAVAVPGQPVRMLWTREQEHGWEPLGPAMLTEAEADLNAAGRIVRWRYSVWSNPHSTRPIRGGDLLAGRELSPALPKSRPRKIAQPEGDGDRNAIPIYSLPVARVQSTYVTAVPRRVSSLRGLGAHMNVFAIESFMDELAHAAGTDPVDFRLRHLEDPRAIAVINEAADHFGWHTYRRGPTRAAGFAFSRYKNLAAYCAIAIELEIEREAGSVTPLRVVAAVDSGEIVNPDGVRNQIEGGIVQTLSWTALESVQHAADHRISLDWRTYPILRFSDVPRRVEVYLIDRPGTPMLGSGEASQGPASAAYANAIFAVTGERYRSMPLRPTRPT